MSIRNRVKSSLLRAYVSPDTRRRARALSEARRKLSGSAHVVTAFLQLDDPYSYLLAHYLPAFAAHFDVRLDMHLSQALRDGFQPAPDMLAEYAVEDCMRLARELGIPFLDKGASPPAEHRRAVVDQLAAMRDTPGFAGALYEALALYWRGDSQGLARRFDADVERGPAEPLIDPPVDLLRKQLAQLPKWHREPAEDGEVDILEHLVEV